MLLVVRLRCVVVVCSVGSGLLCLSVVVFVCLLSFLLLVLMMIGMCRYVGVGMLR